MTASGEITFTCYGARVVVRSSVSGLVEYVERHLPPGAVIQSGTGNDDVVCTIDPDPDRPGWCRFVPPDGRAELVPVEFVAEHVADSLHYVVAENAAGCLFVHAGAVALEGRGIVLPGRTHAGKSSLVRALVEAGATYYSDEYAVFGGDGFLHPYARPLGMRDPDGTIVKVPVAVIGGVVGEEPARVGLIASLVYAPEAGWEVATLRPGDAVLRLFGNAVLARLRPEEALSAFSRAVGGAVAIDGTRGDARAAAAALIEYAKGSKKQ